MLRSFASASVFERLKKKKKKHLKNTANHLLGYILTNTCTNMGCDSIFAAFFTSALCHAQRVFAVLDTNNDDEAFNCSAAFANV